MEKIEELKKKIKDTETLLNSLQKELIENKYLDEEYFLDFINNSIIKFDNEKYPDYIFWFTKDNVCLCKLNFESKRFSVNFTKIWNKPEHHFNLSFTEKVISLIQKTIEKRFLMQNVTIEVGSDIVFYGSKMAQECKNKGISGLKFFYYLYSFEKIEEYFKTK